MGRLARGSMPPHRFRNSSREWIAGAVHARFPKLAAALGEHVFETMLAAYFAREPEARNSVRESGARLAGFLASCPEYPLWYAELAALDRAHVEVLYATPTPTLSRKDLTHERALRLVPGHALVELTTASDELWASLAALPTTASWNRAPRGLDWPRTVLVWRTDAPSAQGDVRDRTVAPDEACALRAAQRGTTLTALYNCFTGVSPHARALDTVLSWIDAGVLVR